jgi:hypothetical protein
MRYWWLIAAVICLILGGFWVVVLCSWAWIPADGFFFAATALCIGGLWRKGGPFAARLGAMFVLAAAITALLYVHSGLHDFYLRWNGPLDGFGLQHDWLSPWKP